MADDMKLRNYSQSTIDAYTYHLGKFSQFLGKRPKCNIPLRLVSTANPNDPPQSFRPKTPATAPPVVTPQHFGCIISSMSLFESH